MKKLIIANWKMHGSLEKIIADIDAYLSNEITNSPNLVLALPCIYLPLAKARLQKFPQANIKLAAQDVSKFLSQGAYTGEIAADMLKEFGVEYVLVGHSERRMFFHETNHTMAKKIDAVIMNNMIPVFCFGEERLAREKGHHLEILTEQLQLLHLIEVPIKELVIAYEPVWSVGTGKVPTSQQMLEVFELINGFVQNYLPHARITTLYGGSVNATNIEKILSIDKNGGVLVGGASLKVEEFSEMCSLA